MRFRSQMRTLVLPVTCWYNYKRVIKLMVTMQHSETAQNFIFGFIHSSVYYRRSTKQSLQFSCDKRNGFAKFHFYMEIRMKRFSWCASVSRSKANVTLSTGKRVTVGLVYLELFEFAWFLPSVSWPEGKPGVGKSGWVSIGWIKKTTPTVKLWSCENSTWLYWRCTPMRIDSEWDNSVVHIPHSLNGVLTYLDEWLRNK